VRFGSWSVRSLYRSESLNIVAKKLLKCVLDLVGVLEVGLDKGSTEGAEEFTLSDEKGN
jgi:hypothetical protein